MAKTTAYKPLFITALLRFLFLSLSKQTAKIIFRLYILYSSQYFQIHLTYTSDNQKITFALIVFLLTFSISLNDADRLPVFLAFHLSHR